MPPTKCVSRLTDNCIACINNFVISFVKNEQYYYHDDEKGFFNCIFQCELHPMIIEKLLHCFDESFRLTDYHKKTLLKIYRHPFIKNFNLKIKLPYETGFYEGYIRGLNNLTILNLSKVCTDEILEVVGENCSLLQIIHIISRTESFSNKRGKELNALKLKFFVSDKGLEYLHKCRFLKKIYMDKIVRSCCGGRKITHNGIRSLLYSLSNIHHISYNDMGLVLEECDYSSERFKLVHIHDNHATAEHIDTYNAMCPALKSLCLVIPSIISNPNVPINCLERLQNSQLCITFLLLKMFPFESTLQRFLQIKGQYLSALSLEHDSTYTTESLLVIGMHCQNLKQMSIRILHSSSSDNDIAFCMGKNKYFMNLEVLKIFGINWDPNIVFPLCIGNAKNMTCLCVYNKFYDQYVDNVFENIFSYNSLANLSELCILDGFIMNVTSFTKFVLNCKNLKEITVKSDVGYDEVLEVIKLQNNLELSIKTDNIPNYSYCFCNYF